MSTEEQAASGLGLEAQRRAITTECERRGWGAPVILEDLGVSGSVAPGRRVGMTEALDTAYKAPAGGKGAVLIVAKLDRATRSVGDLCGLLDALQKRGVAFVALDLGVDTTTPMGAAMAQISGVFAELERKLIGERTKAALAERRSQGQRLGRPVSLAGETRERVRRLLSDGASYADAAKALNDEGLETVGGQPWTRHAVRGVSDSLSVDDSMAMLT